LIVSINYNSPEYKSSNLKAVYQAMAIVWPLSDCTGNSMLHCFFYSYGTV